MTRVRIGGAELYREVAGSGEPLLLLHGGFCSLEHLRPYGDLLAERFTVHAYERPGHGRTADVDGPFSYEAGLADLLAYLDAHALERVHLVGYSDGAILGLLLAVRHPERVRSLVAISGNLDPSGFAGSDEYAAWTVAAGSASAPPPVDEPDRERAWYDALSPDGPGHADVILGKLMTLWTTEPSIDPAELAAISAPTLIVAGDRDSIRTDHSRLIAASIPLGRLCIVPGASHGLLTERPTLVEAVLRDFYDTV